MSTQTWSVDPAHSHLTFKVRHMMLARVRGEFERWSAAVTLDTGALASSSVEATVEVASLNTNQADRDNHLRSADFFDAATFPTMRFVSGAVRVNGDDVEVDGHLTIRDQTHPITLTLEHTGQGTDPWGNARVGFVGGVSINRKDFGLTWNQALETGGVLVGEKVEIELDVQLVRAKS